jgi:cytochrome P450
VAGVRTFLQNQTRRGLMALAGRRTIDLSQLDRVPARLTWPLEREEMDPVSRLGAVRDAEPVHRLTSFLGITVWMVTGPDEVRAVLANERDFSNDIRPLVGRRGSTTDGDIGGLGFTDPPEHTRLRRILTPSFTMHRLERLRPMIAAIVERRLDEMESRGPEVDLLAQFAFPVPFSVICDLLGLPGEDREGLRELVSARFDVTHGGQGTFGAVSESRKFLIESTARQRVHPGDGLLGDIIRDQGDAISDFDLAGLADGVFTGGLETSASMLALGTAVLLDRPDDYAALVQHPERVEPTVEELLRYLSVVQIAFPRFARSEVTVGTEKIRPGDVVICHLAGANRAGPGTDPDTFDPDRPRSSHVAFGHGFHRCVGAELARMELRIALPALARRFPDLALAVPPADLDFRQLSIVYGVDSLPVRLHPAGVNEQRAG